MNIPSGDRVMIHAWTRWVKDAIQRCHEGTIVRNSTISAPIVGVNMPTVGGGAIDEELSICDDDFAANIRIIYRSTEHHPAAIGRDVETPEIAWIIA